jgi:type II secretory pathway component PulF
MAVTGAWVFPDEFRHILAVAEESGRLPEAMRHQARRFQEEGERKIKGLMQTATWLVWLIYAIFAIILISQLAGIYVGALNK